MSKAVSLIILFVSLLAIATAQICTNETTSADETPTVQFCCEGYRETTRTPDTLLCEPICEPACVNGVCNLEHHCVCFDGYKMSLEGNCEPVCDKPCVNGRCSGPNQCQCGEGYSTDFETKECVMLSCNGQTDGSGCIRGTCVGYNKCLCNNGTVLFKGNPLHCMDVELAEWLENSEKTLIGKKYILIALIVVIAALILYIIFLFYKKRRSANRFADDYYD